MHLLCLIASEKKKCKFRMFNVINVEMYRTEGRLSHGIFLKYCNLKILILVKMLL